MVEALWRVPVFVWVLGLVGLGGGAWYAHLAVRQAQGRAAGEASLRGLRRLYEAVRSFAETHQKRLPPTLSELAPEMADGFAYRPIPRRDLDDRLVVAYDRQPRHTVIDFPRLRGGRGVLLITGKTIVVTEEQLEKLLHADNALRAKLGLDELEIVGRDAADLSEAAT